MRLKNNPVFLKWQNTAATIFLKHTLLYNNFALAEIFKYTTLLLVAAEVVAT